MELIFCCVKESEDFSGYNIIKQEIEIDSALNRKIEFICSFWFSFFDSYTILSFTPNYYQ